MTNFTIVDLEQAKAKLAAWNERFDEYTGNNPDKYQADIRSARERVREIELALKDAGVIPKTEHEKLEDTLDRTFPNARSKEIVEYEGQKYRRHFMPLERSRSRKSVTVWGKSWAKVQD
ncbi:hypothetical protein FHS55_004380 [Angulomicrobium tetraedrale]|uniref:Uncharacterized protein n=1 Tax=Ancylobacter tetraedralis TaxID=217068 RepID=A0A839ZGI9_9HYPH|nr:hypothetical protein [Ancylobacter tetraedralis]MBB3773736.1 hypothetical protein [Ancylobacter tetraedralis]